MISLNQSSTINNRSNNQNRRERPKNQLPQTIDRKQKYIQSPKSILKPFKAAVMTKQATNLQSVIQRDIAKTRELKKRFPDFEPKVKNGKEYLFTVSSEDEVEDI